MSYTVTIEEPEKAAWFERKTAKMSPVELGDLFVAVLAECSARRDDANRQSRLSVVQRLSGVARNVDLGDDDHGILARAMLEKYERISK